MQLSPHFALSELTVTTRRDGSDIDKDGDTKELMPNVPTDAHLGAMARLCMDILEPIRQKFGPVVIHSGYRSAAVNAAIGGSATSQHSKGQAADFHCTNASLETVMRWIVMESGLPYGQVIIEKSKPGQYTWLHISLGSPYRKQERCLMALTFDGAKYAVWKP